MLRDSDRIKYHDMKLIFNKKCLQKCHLQIVGPQIDTGGTRCQRHYSTSMGFQLGVSGCFP